jgi:tetratricopeptide (TPR) repeat protein
MANSGPDDKKPLKNESPKRILIGAEPEGEAPAKASGSKDPKDEGVSRGKTPGPEKSSSRLEDPSEPEPREGSGSGSGSGSPPEPGSSPKKFSFSRLRAKVQSLDPKTRRRLFLGVLLLLVIIPSLFLAYKKYIKGPGDEMEFSLLLERVSPYLRAEENSLPPPPEDLLDTDADTPEIRLLKEGTESFLSGSYGIASESFRRLSLLKPNEPLILPLIGASNLRGMNFSLARDNFLEVNKTNLESVNPLAKTSSDLGLALALFNLGDSEKAYPPARGAYEKREDLLGSGDSQTLSAANILSGILIGMGDGITAEDILEEEIRSALEKGLTPEDPLLLDSLNLLAFSYELRGSKKTAGGLLPDSRGEESPSLSASPSPSPPPAPSPSSQIPPLLSELLEPFPGSDPNAQASGSPSSASGSSSPSPSPSPSSSDPASSPDLGSGELAALYNRMARSFPESPVRAELLRAMASSFRAEGPLCSEPDEGSGEYSKERLWELCSALGDALIDNGLFEEGFLIVSELMGWKDLQKYRGKHRLFKNAALQNFERGKPEGAEEFLKLALRELSQKDSLTDEETAFLILRSVTLGDILLSQGRPKLEAETELTGMVSLLETKIGKEDLDKVPESPMLFWYLGRIFRDEGKDRDSKNYFQRAERAANAALSAHPDKDAELTRLIGLIQEDGKARKGSAPSFPASPGIFFHAEKSYAGKYPKLPSPEAMRLELNALKALGKIPMFSDRIEWALKKSQEENSDLKSNLRYQSLKLKFLEEMGQYEDLYKELDLMIKSTKIDDPLTKALFQSSAKSYEARVKLAQGDRSGALKAYETALGILSTAKAPPEREEAIRKEIEAIRRLGE